MAEINLEIISPDKVIYQDGVDSITIPGSLGGFQVLKNHAPLISTIEVGIVIVKKENESQYFTTGGGTIEVMNNKVLILADSMEKVEDINIDRAKQAKERAAERLAKKKEEEINVARAELALKKSINRISSKGKYI